MNEDVGDVGWVDSLLNTGGDAWCLGGDRGGGGVGFWFGVEFGVDAFRGEGLGLFPSVDKRCSQYT